MITDKILDDNVINAAKKAEISHQRIEMLINRQCKSLFQQGDRKIRKQRPELVYLLESSSVAQERSNDSLLEKLLLER